MKSGRSQTTKAYLYGMPYWHKSSCCTAVICTKGGIRYLHPELSGCSLTLTSCISFYHQITITNSTCSCGTRFTTAVLNMTQKLARKERLVLCVCLYLTFGSTTWTSCTRKPGLILQIDYEMLWHGIYIYSGMAVMIMNLWIDSSHLSSCESVHIGSLPCNTYCCKLQCFASLI